MHSSPRSPIVISVALACLSACYLSHERGEGPDFSSCDALGGICEGSDLGCSRLGDRHVFAGNADCIERDEGFACCVSLDDWTPAPSGQRCFEDAMCASGTCVSQVCGLGGECRAGGPSMCGADAHCWVSGDVAGFCLPRCEDGTCPGLLVCEPGVGCVPPR
jgi:hypothetical protein